MLRLMGISILPAINIGVAGQYIVLIVAGLLLKRLSLFILFIMTFLIWFGIYFAESSGIVFIQNETIMPIGSLINYSINLIVLALFLFEYDRRKNIQHSLQQSRNMFRLMLDNIPQLVFWKDKDLVYRGCNKNFAKAAGLEDPKDIIGKRDSELSWKTEDTELSEKRDLNIIDSDIPEWKIIEQHDIPGSGVKWFETNKVPFYDKYNNVIGILGTYEDISDRLINERELKASEEKYRSLVEGLNIGIFRSLPGTPGKLLHANKEMANKLGYDSVEELMNSPVDLLYLKDNDRKEFLEELNKNNIIVNKEMYLRKKNGEFFWAEINAKVIRDSDNNILWIDGYGIDKTKKKLTEIALDESEKRIHELVSTIPIVLWSANEDGTIVLSEGKGLSALNVKPGELVGHSIFEMFKDNQEATNNINRAYQGESFSTIERFKDSYFENVYSPLKNDTGEIIGISGISIDVTPIKIAEKTTIETEKKYYNLFENVNDAIVLIDPETNTILEANNKALEMYGYSREELDGIKVPDVFYDIDYSQKNFEKIKEGNAFLNYETVHKRKDGSTIDLLINTAPIEHEGKPAIIAINRDITERKRLLNQLNRTKHMETLGKLAGAVAHDINHILTGLVTYPDMILMDIDDDDPVRTKIEAIKQSGKRAAAIVEDLLIMARGGIIESENIDLNYIIDECLESTEIVQMKKLNNNVIFDTNLDPYLSQISCARINIFKLLLNLITNSVEAMVEGGRLLISTTNCEFTNVFEGYEDIPAGKYVYLSISDTGKGIKQADLKHIFDPYYTKKKYGRSGSGIGLTVVWNVVKEFHGFINVKTEEGLGSVIEIYFPVAQEHVKQGYAQPTIEEYFGNGEQVLIVEDESNQRELTEDLLEKLKYTPYAVASGEEAIDYLHSNKPNVVLMDMLLGKGMDGFDTYKEVKAIYPDVPVVIVSGFSASERIQEALKLGAECLVTKPFTIIEIGKVLYDTRHDKNANAD
ncbi:PAS domain S-box protein [candidate division KSB1 bacterium]